VTQADYDLIDYGPGNGIRLIPMPPEHRLVLMLLLQGVAEQDPRFVISNLVGEKKVSFCAGVSKEAREFCGSAEFMRLCKLIRFNPERRHHPECAARALDDLRSQRSMQLWHARVGHDVRVQDNDKEEQHDEHHFQTASSSAEVCSW